MAVSKFRGKLNEIGRTQSELLCELQKRGYPKLNVHQLSAYGTNQVVGGQAPAVTKLAWEIIDEWTKEAVKRESNAPVDGLLKWLFNARAARAKQGTDAIASAEKAAALELARKLCEEYGNGNSGVRNAG